MIPQLSALVIFIAVFAIAALRKVHLGIVMFPAACGVGVWLAGMPLKNVVGGFPISIMILLVGVTYFFGIAQANGTIDRSIEAVLARVGESVVILPFAFFAITAAVSAMGSPLAGLVMAPVGMPIAKRYGMDPILMALAIGTGLSAGAFAPTSLFGIVSYGTAHQANIDLNPFTLFAVAVVANLILLIAAFLIFGGPRLIKRRGASGAQTTGISPAPVVLTHDSNGAERSSQAPFKRNQIATIVCIFGLVIAVVGCSLAGLEADIGVLCFAFGAVLTLIDPASGVTAVSRIDWSTVLLVGGVVTFVGVLQKMGAVDLLGEAARNAGVPILTALFICLIGALVSAFASTTGILAALVPLAIPLVTSGDVAGWALISALAVCSSIVDVSPFSTVGATLIATAVEDDRPRMTSLLLRWGMAMVVIGPSVLVGALVLPSSPSLSRLWGP
jgi:di/tricarboxylate transporter